MTMVISSDINLHLLNILCAGFKKAFFFMMSHSDHHIPEAVLITPSS